MQSVVQIESKGRGLIPITYRVVESFRNAGIQVGLCHLFIQHTSASLLIMENADPDVLVDLETFISDLVPDGDPRYRHTAEGPDDMPAHVRSMLTATELTIPVTNGRLNLGSWQGIYLWEHRHRPHTRRIIITLLDAG